MVDDEVTARVVRDAGITHSQGYLFGKPATLRSFGSPAGQARAMPMVQAAVGQSLGG